MRVLWVTHNLPDPSTTGGSAVEFDLLRELAAHHEIVLLSSAPDGQPSDALRELGVEVQLVGWQEEPYPTGPAAVARAMVRAAPTLSHWVLRDRLRALGSAARSLEQRQAFDLVHATHGELAPVLAEVSAPTSLLLFDSHVTGKERERRLEPLLRRRLVQRLERRRASAWERRWYARVDGLASVSPEDAAVSERIVARTVDVLPCPVSDAFFDSPTVERSPTRVAFVGTLLFPPNTDAVRWLVREIWPRVLDVVPDAELLVAGHGDIDNDVVAGLIAEVRAVGADVWLNVPDIRTAYWGSAVSIAPIRLGSGMRTKVLHALACGSVLVATPTAVEGIGIADGREALLGTTAEELTAHIVNLLRDHDLRASLRDGAARLIDRHRVPAIVDRFDSWWHASAARGSARHA